MSCVFTMTMFIEEVENSTGICRYFVHTKNWHFKYYKAEIDAFNNTCIVFYGRIGASAQMYQYTFREWTKKISEKLRKWYIEVFTAQDIERYFGKE